MSKGKMLPLRVPGVSEEKQLEICRLDLRNVSQVEIARRTGVHRNTVRRVLERTRASLAVTQDLGPERARSVAMYQEIIRTAWEAVETAKEKGRSLAALLAEIRLAQTRIDQILGLQMTGPDDPAEQLERLRAAFIEAIMTEAPDAAPRVAQRLLEVSKDDHEAED